MNTQKDNKNSGNIHNNSLKLEDIAACLRRLSPNEIETLELMMNDKAMRTMRESAKDEEIGHLREL
ncbi:MAG: hypothetical protein ABH833_01430 [Parcubacteria group bacterium]